LLTSALPIAAGVGLRTPHIDIVMSQGPSMPWFELLIDNWMAKGGLDQYVLDSVAERYPIAFHGVNMSLGGMAELDFDYLGQVKSILDKTKACGFSEHCSFSNYTQQRTPDLLPLPYTDEAVEHISKRIRLVQSVLERRIMIENVSTYVECHASSMSESQFIKSVLDESDCDLLLDLNNVYVNSVNHDFDATAYVNDLPHEKIKEIHLAGFEKKTGYLLDCHNNPVADEVWNLFEALLAKTGPISTLIEWDNDIPSWQTLVAERNKAQEFINSFLPRENACNL
jgi:uncharacterized protein (UPF0276 family)